MKKNPILASLVTSVIVVLIGFGISGHPAAPTLGALAGPDISSPYVKWGGVPQWISSSATLKTSTTTVCALQSPTSTSTLDWAGIRIDSASSTATIWDVAEATTPYATTTALGTIYALGANAAGVVNASTTGGSAIFPPNTWIVFGVRQAITAGDSAGTGFVPTGSCMADWAAFP